MSPLIHESEALTKVEESIKPAWGKHVDRLLREWDYKANGAQQVYPLTVPLDVSVKAPWWACEAFGHAWQANVSTRIAGRDCPFCAKP